MRLALSLVVVASAATAVLSTGADAATDAASLGGYTGSAAASGVHVFYNPAGLLPTSPPIDLGSPDALATIATGPSTYARASVLDPGDLIVNPDALLSQASSDWPQGTLPPYPYRVESSSGTGGGEVTSSPAPGLDAMVVAGPDSSTAEASTAAAATPGIVTFASMISTATTSTTGSTVTVHAHTEIGGFDLLGLVTIESIVTDLNATSDGTLTKTAGGTTVVGAAVMGQPVTIDQEGMHPDPDSGPPSLLGGVLGSLSPLFSDLNGLLSEAGIHLTVAGPVELEGDTAGQLASTGLRVDVEVSERTFPYLKTLIDLVPPIDSPIPGAPGPEDVLAVLGAQHLVSIDLGRGVVALEARPGFDFVPAPFVPTVPVVVPAPVPAVLPESISSDLPVVGSPVQPTPAAVPAPTLEPAVFPVSFGPGIGGLALLVLVLQPLIGDRLARMCRIVLTGEVADACGGEEP